jgi:hypothetical protein
MKFGCLLTIMIIQGTHFRSNFFLMYQNLDTMSPFFNLFYLVLFTMWKYIYGLFMMESKIVMV